MKPLTANRGLPFALRWPNLDLKVSNIRIRVDRRLYLVHLDAHFEKREKRNVSFSSVGRLYVGAIFAIIVFLSFVVSIDHEVRNEHRANHPLVVKTL